MLQNMWPFQEMLSNAKYTTPMAQEPGLSIGPPAPVRGHYLFDFLFLTPLAPFQVQRDHITPPRQQPALRGFQGTCRSFYSK